MAYLTAIPLKQGIFALAMCCSNRSCTALETDLVDALVPGWLNLVGWCGIMRLKVTKCR